MNTLKNVKIYDLCSYVKYGLSNSHANEQKLWYIKMCFMKILMNKYIARTKLIILFYSHRNNNAKQGYYEFFAVPYSHILNLASCRM